MNDRDALLAAITANPDEDTPRLVYADWLTEHGEGERAEFIRVQCRLTHLSPRTAEGRRLALREKELREKLFGHLDALGFAGLTFRRGFVDQVGSGFFHFRDRAASLTPELAPAFGLKFEKDNRDSELWESHYEEWAWVVGEAGASGEIRRCVSLDLPCLGLDPSSYLFDSEQFVNVRWLNFPSNEAGPNIESVASPVFANLRWANFNYSNSANGRPSIIPLAECPHLANLEYLDFGSNALGDEDAKAVAAAAQWACLRFLSLAGGRFSVKGVGALFVTPHLHALVELDLSHSFKADAGDYLAVIVASPLLARLSHLSLCGNNLDNAAAKALAAAPAGVQLTRLDLRNNPIGVRGERALVKRFGPGVCLFGEERT